MEFDLKRDTADASEAVAKIKLYPEDYQPDLKKRLNEMARKANIPGFRKGHVPAGIIQKMYGDDLRMEVIGQGLTRRLYEQLNQQGVEVSISPLLVDSNVTDKNADVYEAEYLLSLAQDFNFDESALSGIPSYEVEIDDETVNHYIERYQKQRSTEQEHDRVEEDTLVEFYATLADREAPAGEEARLRTLTFNNADEDLQKKLKGEKAGNTIKKVDFASLPQYMQDAIAREHGSSAGELAHEKLTLEVKAVKKLIPAELDQTFFDWMTGPGEVTNVEELKAKIKEQLHGYYRALAAQRRLHELEQRVMESVAYPMSKKVLKKHFENLVHRQKHAQGEEHDEHHHEHIEDNDPRLEDFANSVKSARVFERLADLYKVEVDNQDITRAAYDHVASRNPYLQYLGQEQVVNMVKQHLADADNYSARTFDARKARLLQHLAETIQSDTRQMSSSEFDALNEQ